MNSYLALLLLAVLIVPALWGALVHWLVGRLWPPQRRRGRALREPDRSRVVEDYWDYQI